MEASREQIINILRVADRVKKVALKLEGSIQDLSKKLDTTSSPVFEMPPRHGEAWTSFENQVLLNRIRDVSNLLATEFGRTPVAIRFQMIKLLKIKLAEEDFK